MQTLGRAMFGLTVLIASASGALAQQAIGRPVPDAVNARGLRCWGIRGGGAAQTFVFQEPSTSAPRIGRVTSWVAVTGASQNGFLPIETPAGPRGWVMEELVERDTWANMKCVAQRQPTGRVYFIYGGTPPGR
ncbi:MAG: SH3 domain-containing protein [Oxalobacteraceae bacterium]|nr:MAG: SH3 domain-containing protein [Oxalobacteraceae bacterium]